MLTLRKTKPGFGLDLFDGIPAKTTKVIAVIPLRACGPNCWWITARFLKANAMTK